MSGSNLAGPIGGAEHLDDALVAVPGPLPSDLRTTLGRNTAPGMRSSPQAYRQEKQAWTGSGVASATVERLTVRMVGSSFGRR
jgi:hypothetical protein